MSDISVESNKIGVVRKVESALQHLKWLSACLTSSNAEKKACMHSFLANSDDIQQEYYDVFLDACGDHAYSLWSKLCIKKGKVLLCFVIVLLCFFTFFSFFVYSRYIGAIGTFYCSY